MLWVQVAALETPCDSGVDTLLERAGELLDFRRLNAERHPEYGREEATQLPDADVAVLVGVVQLEHLLCLVHAGASAERAQARRELDGVQVAGVAWVENAQ